MYKFDQVTRDPGEKLVGWPVEIVECEVEIPALAQPSDGVSGWTNVSSRTS